MPTYHARGVTVRLGSLPLAETTTSDVVLKKGEAAKRQSEAAEKKLLRSFLLAEKRVLFPGDPDGYELNWIGNAPFMQVQINNDSFQSPAPNGSPHRTSASTDRRPQALTLHVKLSDKTFNSGFAGKTHLKIDVLFNAQLSACSLIHTNDIRSGAKSLHQVFAGYRVDFLAERPWVILPPYTTADGGTRRFRKTVTTSERWEEINAMLLKEAEQRGTSVDGDLPPSAEFLQALAKMQMPTSVKGMQKPGGRRFGVVDVVVTAGTGSKLTSGTNYLKNPQKLRDPRYTVQTEATSENEAATAESKEDGEVSGRPSQAQVPDLIDTDPDAEGESDALQERPLKRRALSHNSFAQSLFSGAQIPHLSPPRRLASHKNLSPTTGRIDARCPSPEHRSDGHKQPLPSKGCQDEFETTIKVSGRQNWSNNASRASEGYRVQSMNVQLSAPPALRMQPSSMDLPFPTPIAGHRAFGDSLLMTSTPKSSPVMQTVSIHSPPHEPLMSSGITSLASGTSPVHSTSYVAPTALMQSTPADWMSPSSAMATPYYRRTYPQQQAHFRLCPKNLTSYMPPNRPPSLLPQTPPFLGLPGPVTPSPAVFLPPGSLPPTAMFTVTSKPKRSASPAKGAGSIDLGFVKSNATRRSILINRLVITGLGGKPVVDHSWKTARYVAVNHGHSDDLHARGRDEAPTIKFEGTSMRRESACRNISPRYRLLVNSSNNNLQHTVAEHSDHKRRLGNAQDGQDPEAVDLELPYFRRLEGPPNKYLLPESETDNPDSLTSCVFTPMQISMVTPNLLAPAVYTPAPASVAQPPVSQVQPLSQNVLLGIRPKAATFLPDDPGEILGGAARTRRSRSPTNPPTTQSTSLTTTPVQVALPTNHAGKDDSSPLSSVPSSPVPERAANADEILNMAVNHYPQLDGSPERTISSTSPRKLHTPSSTKRSVPKLKSGPATPQSYISPTSKKRKASSRLYTKPPRSPGRLKTVDNPPLNDDCVIAFAESEDKEATRGILRQVKGERQGVFKEEYVVLAVRFFIPGD